MSTVIVAQRLVASDSAQRAHFSTRWPQPKTAVVSVHGELDASNAPEFADYALGYVARSQKLVLDLNAVEFFGATCFATLHTLNVQCAGEGIYWALTPSKAVSRVLRICDPDGALPTSPSVAAALAMLQTEPRPLQLVTERR
ncbi:STAS domain-containing protein [Mycolicibacterium mageritense DSM 44476 = CIP 104973]|uniref:Sulfate transporter n=1 Tax=Mycolicibacterium mageritense TaxID=53462 RepID=A0ABM7HXW1_MYCME|nr:STAS domain-containing protein [Mycolicibacterium mageritense]MBN3452938.1 STAS domain-containing protein [Mycobacterium sp. DSM 3803]MCC9182843.1 STAS domain-containing protein [Mycolicibacterium mageritense]TXI55123.1 MAG: anti-sigma factor antagonist [Mycolicibacterium mageritense]CDO20069.1 STAS domain-containing protein [Mycolicibacterium mageritense DSM 44476 = CIP 104973]BBX35423.1 sulfate transporter [Mycolicibacterium mageritense]